MRQLKYTRKVRKGDLCYHDFLTIDRDKKTILFVKEVDSGDEKPVSFKLKSSPAFLKSIKKYLEIGYHLIEKDGAEDRCKKEEILNALDLHTVVSTYADLCKTRPEPYTYFSLARIENAINCYIEEGMSFFDLRFWCQLFTFSVEESFDYPLTFQNAFQFAVVKKLNEYMMEGRHMGDDISVREHLRKVMPEIYAIREKYYKMLGLKLDLEK